MESNEGSKGKDGEWCNIAPRSVSLSCAGCAEQQQPDWSQWPKEIDAVSKRPRTPNDPYTHLNNEMIKNIGKDSSPHFRKLDHSTSKTTGDTGTCCSSFASAGRRFRPRYAGIIDKNLLRGQPTSQNLGVITPERFYKEAQEPYTTCSQEAFEKWPGQMAGQHWLGDASQQKGGLATKSHTFGERHERFTTIDMYRRPNTNCPEPCQMKFGRPGHGYYLQRYPNTVPYFNSEIPLNQQDVLQDIWPKTTPQYKHQDALVRDNYAQRDRIWPGISEYANSYIRKDATYRVASNPKEQKLFDERAKAKADCDFLMAA